MTGSESTRLAPPERRSLSVRLAIWGTLVLIWTVANFVATETAENVLAEAPAGATVPALLKLALAHLGPARAERTGV